MSVPLGLLIEEALALPSSERARLASVLIASLDDEPGADRAEAERAWELEIERRVAEHRSGRAVPIAASEVLIEARQLCEEHGSARSTEPIDYEPPPIPLDTGQIGLLLDELCTELGLCLPPSERARLQARPLGAVTFVAAVLRAEGLDPESTDPGLRRQIRECVRKRLSKDS